jgi:hypothetical protein
MVGAAKAPAGKSRRLSVLHVATVNKPITSDIGYGPIETVIYNIDKGLHALGHRSIVACSSDSKVTGDLEGEGRATLVVNEIRGTLHCAAVKAPGFGDRREAMLEDLAILTGGKMVAEELGVKPDSATLADLGRAKRIIIDKVVRRALQNASSVAGLLQRSRTLRHRCPITACSRARTRGGARAPRRRACPPFFDGRTPSSTSAPTSFGRPSASRRTREHSS